MRLSAGRRPGRGVGVVFFVWVAAGVRQDRSYRHRQTAVTAPLYNFTARARTCTRIPTHTHAHAQTH